MIESWWFVCKVQGRAFRLRASEKGGICKKRLVSEKYPLQPSIIQYPKQVMSNHDVFGSSTHQQH